MAVATRAINVLIRVLLLFTYLLLAISVLLVSGLVFGSAFIVEFTVENRTSTPIVVTPIGSAGAQGNRYPLPIKMWPFPAISSPQVGGFALPPGETIHIMYDMDDINFSEIVVQRPDGELGALVVNSIPSGNSYRPPEQTVFVIEARQSLLPVSDDVNRAARLAEAPSRLPWIELSLIIGPWIAYPLVLYCQRLSISKTSRIAAA